MTEPDRDGDEPTKIIVIKEVENNKEEFVGKIFSTPEVRHLIALFPSSPRRGGRGQDGKDIIFRSAEGYILQEKDVD